MNETYQFTRVWKETYQYDKGLEETILYTRVWKRLVCIRGFGRSWSVYMDLEGDMSVYWGLEGNRLVYCDYESVYPAKAHKKMWTCYITGSIIINVNNYDIISVSKLE